MAEKPKLHVITDQASLKRKFKNAKGTAVLFFGSDSCPACQSIMGEFGELMVDYPNVHFYKIPREARDLFKLYDIHLMPTFIVVKGDKEYRFDSNKYNTPHKRISALKAFLGK